MMGKGSINHNTRAFTAKNVDSERSIDNVEFCNQDIKAVYHEMFDDALERYNAKQKRNDRKIDNYYEKIRQSRQEKLFYEAIFQIGNKDDMNAKSSDGELAKNILTDFMEEFQQRNPNLRVFSAHLHMDEETPHLHIDFIPFTTNSKRGLDTRVSLKSALADMGFRGGTRGSTEWNQWMDAEKQELSKVMERYGVEWKQLGTNREHLSVLDFKKQERIKEIEQLDAIVEDKKETIASSEQQVSILEEIKAEIIKENEEQERKGEELISRRDTLAKEVDKILNVKGNIQRNVHVYDEQKEWQLPEPGVFTTAKAYYDKVAKPLIGKFKELVRDLTIRCIRLDSEVKQLKNTVKEQGSSIAMYRDRIAQNYTKMEQMQETLQDFDRVKRFIGEDKAQFIIDRAKYDEKIEAEQNRQRQVQHKGMSR
jgi:hypothetical protein